MHPSRQVGVFSNALIYPNGKVLIVPDAHLEALCHEADLEDFWAPQNCTLKYGSWTYDGNMVNLDLFSGMEAWDFKEFSKNAPVEVRWHHIT